MVGPNFDGTPLLELALLLVFFVRFSLVQEKCSELGHT